MAIRTLVAAAALFAITTPAFASGPSLAPADAEVVIVESNSMLDDMLQAGGFSAGKTAIFIGAVLVALVLVENGKTTVTTVSTN